MGAAELLAQHAALTTGLGCADVSGRTLLEIRGSDRVTFLHAFCTNNIKSLQPGQGCEAFITSPQGKTLGHVVVWSDADRLLLETSPGQARPLIAHFDKYVISEDVQFVDRTAEWAELLIAGPQAPEVIAGLTIPARRSPLLGPNCYAIVAPRAELPALPSAVHCAAEAVETARIEAGFPVFGRDITEDNLPQEVGRDAQAISFTKGCYLGQETVARIDALGHVNRKLVGLKFAAPEPASVGTPLLAAEKEVGRVTSAAWSPRLNTPLALGYVKTLHSKPGTQLASPAGAAEVVSLPLAP